MPLKDETTANAWPNFTEAQVAFLERLYPPRCLGPHEQVEDHLRYAGKSELVATLRGTVIGSTAALEFNGDEEEAMDAMAQDLAGQPQE